MKKFTINYWLSEHPSVVGFRWSLTMWGSTWSFLITSIATYILSSLTLHLALLLLLGRRPVPVGRLSTLHSLAMSLVSSAIFLGTLSSAAAEIRDTRWMWQRSRTTPFEWLLCFPVGTRPSGRVFFWSYAFYLSRFLHVLRTYLVVLRRRTLSPFHLFNHSILICMSFLWLEFTQSFQVVAILIATLGFAAVNACRFLRDVGVRRPEWFLTVANCHLVPRGRAAVAFQERRRVQRDGGLGLQLGGQQHCVFCVLEILRQGSRHQKKGGGFGFHG